MLAGATGCAAHGQTGSAAASATGAPKLTVEPNVFVPGQSYTLVLTVDAVTCKNGRFFDDKEVKVSSAADLQLGLLGTVQGDACKRTLPLTVSKNAGDETLTLFVNTKQAQDVAAVTFFTQTVKVQTAVGPGPIPPGLAPSLDLMWKVLPRRAVADSYGSRVADGYFAIEAVLGNETGYDLQLSALGFEVPFTYCRAKLSTKRLKDPGWDYCTAGSQQQNGNITEASGKNKNDPRPFSVAKPKPRDNEGHLILAPLPVDSYPVVRGTIEREQSVGTRAIVVNLVKGAGSVLVGVGGFFPSDGTFVRTDGIFSGPFEKALELVYPDLTTNHLVSLDSRTLRDGVVVPNNTSFRINAFISREVVQCGYPKKFYMLGFVPQHSFNCLQDDARLPWQRDFEPNEVMARLGEMVLTGRKIQYLERVRVLKSTSDLPTSVGGPLVTSGTIPLTVQTDQAYTIAGMNLLGTTIKPLSLDVAVKSQTVAADGRSIDVVLNSLGARPDRVYRFQVQSPTGVTFADAVVQQPVPTLTSATLSAKSADGKLPTVTGKYLWHVEIVAAPDASGATKAFVASLKPAASAEDGTSFSWNPATLPAAGEYKLIVRTPGGDAGLTLTVTP